MKIYQTILGRGIDELKLTEVERAPLQRQQIRVRLRAASLNPRDFLVMDGHYPMPIKSPVVLASDGAGEIIDVGEGVTRFRVGDRVISTFYPDWLDGEPTPAKIKHHLAGPVDGTLAEEADYIASLYERLAR
jgi:NADPH:quinone reductase-like Zn-dependent oxidoreductase